MAIPKALTYFHRQILLKMLSWEALSRPTSIKLKKIFSDENLLMNLDNTDFVDQLISSVMKTEDNQIMEEFKKN